MTAGDIGFIQYQAPALRSGVVTVTVNQEVRIRGALTETFTAGQALAVAGLRTAIGPDAVNSVFPPAGGEGAFAAALPHIILADASLPWQRSPTAGSLQGPRATGEPRPSWLAVFLFNEHDPAPEPRTLPRDEAFAERPGLLVPYQDEPGEGDAATVTVIDIPVSLFNVVAPSLKDLSWLAHVRQATPPATTRTAAMAFRAQRAAADATRDQAVVIGGRLPVGGQAAVAHLISLEGYAEYLPGTDGVPAVLPPGTVWVRLITLHSWSFTISAAGGTFAAGIANVNVDPPALCLPVRPPLAAPAGHPAEADGIAESGGAADAVAAAFGMGYTAVNHGLRDGGSTVSWYRGPLLPFDAAPPAEPPAFTGDERLRYDPQSGMFDASAAVAWQTGRLLALRDESFAAALIRWRAGQARRAAIELAARIAAGGAPADDGRPAPTRQQLAARLGRLIRAAAAPPAPVEPAAPAGARRGRQPRPDRAALRQALATPDVPPSPTAADGDDPEPDKDLIADWLQRLADLDGVPFDRLVPDIRMLPAESIRFFQVDPGWVAALLDGAVSIARRPGDRNLRRDGDPGPQSKGPPVPLRPAAGGFVLRSAAVTGWPDLRVTGYSDLDGEHQLDIIRLDVLAPSVLYCLFDGVPARVDLREPEETLHFGVLRDGTGDGWHLTLRYADDTPGRPVGTVIPGVSVPVAARPGGVLRIADAAAAMDPLVWGAPTPPRPFTAAEFALEMVAAAGTVSFQFTPPAAAPGLGRPA
jgi:hypothetical protein